LGFATASKHLPNASTVYLGTPVRSQFYVTQSLNLNISKDTPVIVVVGGSQGAVALNRLIEASATPWLEAGACVIHITGEQDYNEGTILEHPLYVRLPFYENMAALFQRANLIISRAGAATLNEITITQSPSILIPYPYAAEDHQYFNAQVLASAGAALVFRQEKLTPSFLAFEVLDLLKSPKRLQTMQFNSASLSVINSAELLGDLIKQYL
jgi:UDP-N-acetylglucosamine--N-acetylmuramyl-(pentapeptide) pyrophosphoryl-undecaprenol N-acetylglucosamine transferase